MRQPPDLLPFLDSNQKGNAVTEQPKVKEPKPRKATLRLVVEYDHDMFDMEAIKEVVEKAKEFGRVVSAKLSRIPTSTDLA